MQLNQKKVDEIILATAMNMASSGESRDDIVKAMEKMGWGEVRAELAVDEIFKFVKPKEDNKRLVLLALIPAVLSMLLLFYWIGDRFLILPEWGVMRAVASLGYAIGFPLVFFIIWVFFVLILS